MARYKVLVGIDYAGKRAEVGTFVDDIPTKSASWLLEQGILEAAPADTKPAKREPESPAKGVK